MLTAEPNTVDIEALQVTRKGEPITRHSEAGLVKKVVIHAAEYASSPERVGGVRQVQVEQVLTSSLLYLVATDYHIGGVPSHARTAITKCFGADAAAFEGLWN